ncbi:hypothetical protein [Kingella oralis]|uniref:hypothetical protein n=1 Tax=Kingella oralis TaxID=505 RepID=UPI002D800D46|nr:hypothetical protein [Kingella oralis]
MVPPRQAIRRSEIKHKGSLKPAQRRPNNATHRLTVSPKRFSGCRNTTDRQPENGNEISGCPSLIFRPRRRFAACHEQGQAPAPRAASSIPAKFTPCRAMTQQQLAAK